MNEEYEIGKQIQMLSRKIKRKMDETFLNYGITGGQAFILKFIYDKSKKDKIYARDIENEFDMRRPTVTGILQLMEQNKLIQRKAEGKDARLKEIVITKRGLDIVNNVDLNVEQVEKELVNGITKEEIQTFLVIIGKLSKNIS